MSQVFVISDPHFGCEGIRYIPGREMFRNMIMEEHDQAIVDNWNSVVTKRDKVLLLGDVGRDSNGYLRNFIVPQLTGTITIVGGNHDTAEALALFGKVNGVLTKSVNGHRCVITHIPIHPQEMYWDYNIHGHLHSNVVRKHANDPQWSKAGERDPRYINVCCEHMAFTPQPIEEVVPR